MQGGSGKPRWWHLWLVSVLVVVVAACSSTGSSDTTAPASETTTAGNGDTELPVIRLSSLSGGLSSVALTAMQVNKFDEANGFEGQYFFRDSAAAIPFFLQGHSDISLSGDPVQTAIARLEGYPVTNFHAYLTNNTCVLVRNDSEYENIEDLVGQTVGHFGLDSGTTATFTVLLDEYFGISVVDDFELVEAGPPVLVELLANGEVEAIMNFVPNVTRALVEADARCLFGPVHQEMAERGGEISNYLGLAMAHEEFLAENPDLVDAYLAAWADTLEWIMANPEALSEEPYTSLVGQSNPDVLAQFAEQVVDVPLYVDEWSPEIRAGLDRFLELAAEEGTLIQEVPEGTFTDPADFR